MDTFLRSLHEGYPFVAEDEGVLARLDVRELNRVIHGYFKSRAEFRGNLRAGFEAVRPKTRDFILEGFDERVGRKRMDFAVAELPLQSDGIQAPRGRMRREEAVLSWDRRGPGALGRLHQWKRCRMFFESARGERQIFHRRLLANTSAGRRGRGRGCSYVSRGGGSKRWAMLR